MEDEIERLKKDENQEFEKFIEDVFIPDPYNNNITNFNDIYKNIVENVTDNYDSIIENAEDTIKNTDYVKEIGNSYNIILDDIFSEKTNRFYILLLLIEQNYKKALGLGFTDFINLIKKTNINIRELIIRTEDKIKKIHNELKKNEDNQNKDNLTKNVTKSLPKLDNQVKEKEKKKKKIVNNNEEQAHFNEFFKNNDANSPKYIIQTFINEIWKEKKKYKDQYLNKQNEFVTYVKKLNISITTAQFKEEENNIKFFLKMEILLQNDTDKDSSVIGGFTEFIQRDEYKKINESLNNFINKICDNKIDYKCFFNKYITYSKNKIYKLFNITDQSAINQATIKIGDKIEGNYKGIGKWYPGRIKKINSNGTYDIRYDDGDIENAISTGMIRLTGEEGATSDSFSLARINDDNTFTQILKKIILQKIKEPLSLSEKQMTNIISTNEDTTLIESKISDQSFLQLLKDKIIDELQIKEEERKKKEDYTLLKQIRENAMNALQTEKNYDVRTGFEIIGNNNIKKSTIDNNNANPDDVFTKRIQENVIATLQTKENNKEEPITDNNNLTVFKFTTPDNILEKIVKKKIIDEFKDDINFAEIVKLIDAYLEAFYQENHTKMNLNGIINEYKTNITNALSWLVNIFNNDENKKTGGQGNLPDLKTLIEQVSLSKYVKKNNNKLNDSLTNTLKNNLNKYYEISSNRPVENTNVDPLNYYIDKYRKYKKEQLNSVIKSLKPPGVNIGVNDIKKAIEDNEIPPIIDSKLNNNTLTKSNTSQELLDQPLNIDEIFKNIIQKNIISNFTNADENDDSVTSNIEEKDANLMNVTKQAIIDVLQEEEVVEHKSNDIEPVDKFKLAIALALKKKDQVKNDNLRLAIALALKRKPLELNVEDDIFVDKMKEQVIDHMNTSTVIPDGDESFENILKSKIIEKLTESYNNDKAATTNLSNNQPFENVLKNEIIKIIKNNPKNVYNPDTLFIEQVKSQVIDHLTTGDEVISSVDSSFEKVLKNEIIEKLKASIDDSSPPDNTDGIFENVLKTEIRNKLSTESVSSDPDSSFIENVKSQIIQNLNKSIQKGKTTVNDDSSLKNVLKSEIMNKLSTKENNYGVSINNNIISRKNNAELNKLKTNIFKFLKQKPSIAEKLKDKEKELMTKNLELENLNKSLESMSKNQTNQDNTKSSTVVPQPLIQPKNIYLTSSMKSTQEYQPIQKQPLSNFNTVEAIITTEVDNIQTSCVKEDINMKEGNKNPTNCSGADLLTPLADIKKSEAGRSLDKLFNRLSSVWNGSKSENIDMDTNLEQNMKLFYLFITYLTNQKYDFKMNNGRIDDHVVNFLNGGVMSGGDTNQSQQQAQNQNLNNQNNIVIQNIMYDPNLKSQIEEQLKNKIQELEDKLMKAMQQFARENPEKIKELEEQLEKQTVEIDKLKADKKTLNTTNTNAPVQVLTKDPAFDDSFPIKIVKTEIFYKRDLHDLAIFKEIYTQGKTLEEKDRNFIVNIITFLFCNVQIEVK